jgi:hypothetical protein
MAYVDNIRLIEALLESHKAGGLTKECYILFQNICKQRIRLYLKYDRDQHYDAMLTDCMNKVLKVWQNFKFSQDNAFAYFVSVIDNSIRLYFASHPLKFTSIESMDQVFED